MIRSSLPCLLLAASQLAAADFPLEDYVPADFHRRYLSLSPGIHWSRYASESDLYQPGVESDNRDRSAGLGLNYGSVRNSRSLRWDVSTGGSFTIRGGEGTDRRTDPARAGEAARFDQSGDNLTANLGGFTRLSGQWHARERVFLLASGEADLHWMPWSTRDGSGWTLQPEAPGGDTVLFRFSDSEYGNDQADLRMTARLGGGYGRLEEVTFAETGMHLLDRIEEVTGRRVRLGKEGMRDLEAYVEARRKRRAFFDSRRAAIYDLESVARFLAERGLDSLPPRAVLEMADEWRHAGRLRRFSGWEARLFPFLRVQWEEQQGEDDRHDYARRLPLDSARDPEALVPASPVAGYSRLQENDRRSHRGETALGAGAEIAWRRPWRRFWQFDADGWTRYALERQESGYHTRSDTGGVMESRTDRFVEFQYPRLEAGASGAAGWLPTSRTLIRATLDLRMDRKFDYLDPAEAAPLFGAMPEQDALNTSLSLRLDARYHLSDRLLLWANAGFGAGWRDARDEGEAGSVQGTQLLPRRVTSGTRNGSLMAGLNYYLF